MTTTTTATGIHTSTTEGAALGVPQRSPRATPRAATRAALERWLPDWETSAPWGEGCRRAFDPSRLDD